MKTKQRQLLREFFLAASLLAATKEAVNATVALQLLEAQAADDEHGQLQAETPEIDRAA